MKKQIQHISLVLMLLLLGGAMNEAWGKITYHILSLPMTTKQLNGTDHQDGSLVDFCTNVRVEVLRCVSSTLTVGLPFEYKSPLATNYRYYTASSIAQTGPSQLYGYNNTTYYFYNITDGSAYTTNNANYGDGADGDDNTPTDAAVAAGVRLTPGAACSDNIHIYVTYDVKASPEIDLSATLNTTTGLLSPSKEYNIHLKDRMVVLNQNRQNRPGAVLDGYYTPEQLASNDFSWIVKEGLNNTAGWRFFGFKFGGNDPYNVTIYTSYDKSTTFRGIGQNNFSTNDVKDREKYLQKDVFKEYRGSSFFRLMAQQMNDKNMWLSSDADIQWQDGGSRDAGVIKVVPGYFKGPNDNKSNLYEMSPIFNSFAILNHKNGEGYAFAGSKMNTGTNNWQPSSGGQIQFMDYGSNGNNITIVYKAEASVMRVDVYEVKKYIFRVLTPFGSNVDVEMEWSDYSKTEAITTSMIPDDLKRKYVNFTGVFKADTNGDGTPDAAVTTFENAQATCSTDGSGRPIIYVEYEVSGAPFTAIPAADKTTGYATATWYEMTDKDSSGKKIKWDATNSVYKNNGGASEYNKESEFAFIGDPFELRVINRKLTSEAGANQYVGSTSQTTETALTNNASDDGAGYKWEIPYDETLGSFTLREFGSAVAYWNWNTAEGNTIQYTTTDVTPTRIKVMEIGKVNYTFKVVDLAGNIAIQATESLTPFTTLTGYANIPSTIRSPYIADETITFWSTYGGNGRGNLGSQITELPGTGGDIFVKYTTEHLDSKSIKLNEAQSFNVKLNGEYIYWDSSTGKILSNADPGTNPETSNSYLEANQYLWRLRGRDPYAMLIDNIGATVSAHGGFTENETVTIYDDNGTSSSVSRYKGAWVKISDDNLDGSKNLIFDPDRVDASRFIAMLGSYAGVYEVMSATGTTDLYHIGRVSTEGAETKIYSTSTYAHGADQLRFVLEGTELIQYHLIDKSGKELFRNEITSKNARLSLPQEFVSPLVATYHFYASSDVNQSNGADGNPGTEDDIFTPVASPTDLSEAGGNTVIYVFYDVDPEFGFGTSYPRLLKFLNPLAEGYYLEDGADKLTDTKIKAVYPYCNGDGNLNIYGQPMNEEQMNGGSSTRPRWVWFFESDTSDPYHVKIHSKSTIKFSGTSHTTYMQTLAVHFNQDENANLQHIVTGANFPGISLQAATDYMILGTTGHYKLVTSAKIEADLNGDGNTTDPGENERRTVTSFEQYWKTYNMIKQLLLDIKCDPAGSDPYKDKESKVATDYIVPSELRDDLADALDTKRIGSSNWHSYVAIANAVRWNGYNDDGKRNSKVVEKLEHWFQTFDMGDGTFDIETADIPPVLVLLDRHGWEIMRKPLPTSASDPEINEKLAALRAFDSPMVKEYKFYNNATKASGCHKYSIRLNDDGSDKDPIKLNGKQFTSVSLAELPPLNASGVVSGGVIQDHFVTYTVKEEYENSYNPSTSTASKFLVLQNDKYAHANNAEIEGVAVPVSGLSQMIIDGGEPVGDVNLWYVQPNSAIDTEMGYPSTNDTPSYTASENGFDPYNVQLKNASSSKFFTIHMTRSVLDGGAYTGVYTGDGGSTSVTLAVATDAENAVSSPESYDHSTLKMTNQTFMAVQDENGNMQLMPRFDHSHRINVFSTLADPLTEPEGDHSGAQTTQFVRPLVFDYHIIDNNGNTALRYKTGGEFYPAIPEHFKSPLAEDFKFYYGHEAGAAVASTEEAWENAAVIKQKTATDEADMTTKAGAITVPGDYYFKIGSADTYTYKMVTIGKEITGSFAAADIQESAEIKVRYTYDEDYDHDHDQILQGRWMTIQLNDLDVQAEGTVVAANDETSGTGVSLYTGSKPAMNDADAKRWQWKFLASPSVSSSPYYEAPDPYAVKIYNRDANKDTNPTANPNKMGTAIKVSGKDRFVILTHPNGDYALAAAGDSYNSYSFLTGAGMTGPSVTAASVVTDASFSTSPTYGIAAEERLQFINDVPVIYTYKVITNDNLLAASQTQDESTAQSRNFTPFLPEDIQTPLLNQDDYLYYGTASVSEGVYSIVSDSRLNTLYGLYDDVVYVRYNAYNELNSPYKVPNVKGTDGGHVIKGSGSNDTSLGLHANLLYNIIWYNDEMMKSSDDGTAVQSESGQDLQATAKFEWQLEGNDPYAIKIKSVGATSEETMKYIAEATTTTTNLSTTPTTFMILNRDGYDYGVLVKTGTPVVGSSASMLSGYGNTLTTSDPTHFIIFALATYKVIYHLVIAETAIDPENPVDGYYEEIPFWNGTDVINKKIPGTTQRDLKSGSPAGSTYQLGTNLYSILTSGTIGDRLYCVDAGCISLGDVLKVPDELNRPNVVYKYYIEGVYNSTGTEAVADMNTKYKGHERTTMGEDAGLLGKTVLVNIVYTFNGDLETNAGEGFVTRVADNKWYTFETSGLTPYLAHYTNAWGLQSMAGRATRFTNDYLWTPLGDPYGFKMYNRYMCKNSNKPDYVMTTPDLTSGTRLMMGEPGVTKKPESEDVIPTGNEIYELLASGTDGYFYVHPLYNTDNTLFVKRGTDDFAELSTTPTPWTFGLSETLFEPYFERAGYLGGLTTTENGGKDKYETAAAETNPAKRLMKLQKVVYDDGNIIHYSPGYYRLHNQPGVSDIDPVRYASGYLHDIEKTAGAESTPIPMHFYSRKGVSTTFEGDGGLGAGFTETHATRGAIPVPATEYDPSTIFYFPGSTTLEGNPRSTISTQGLYVKGVQTDDNHGDAVMTATAGEATTFSVMDIGAGTFLIHDGSVPTSRKYFHFSQSYSPSGTNMIYDLKYFHNSPTDDAKWCIEPANNQGLYVETHSGGDGYFYTTFCAPYDVLLPTNDESSAYICSAWDSQIIRPTKVPASSPYAEGKFVPAGTPVIIRTKDSESGNIKLTLPSSSPTSALSCVFTGKYLEQLLTTEISESDEVFTFGLPITGYGIITESGATNGDITNVINKNQADTGVGFYLNATRNKELSEEDGLWTPNNRYVLHNKIYYRSTEASGSSARQNTRGVEFVPVIFDDEESEPELFGIKEENRRVYDNRVYDLQGRCVATEEQVKDGTWRQNLRPGIYIINGRKIRL